MCARGCPFAGYFSSVSASLPAARATNNLTLRPFSVVHSIIYDEQKNKATGVRVIDSNTKQTTEYFAKDYFLKCWHYQLNNVVDELNIESFCKWFRQYK